MESCDTKVVAACDDAGLRPAEELVTGEGYQIGACGNAVLGCRFFGEAELPGVDEATAADIVDQGNTGLAGEGGKFPGVGGFGEADDLEVAGVDLQKEGGVFGDGVPVVGQIGAVGGADLDEIGRRWPS